MDSREILDATTPRSAKWTRAVGGKRRLSPGSDGPRRGVVNYIESAAAPTILMFSNDTSLCDFVAQTAGKAWKVERCVDLRNCRKSLVRPEMGLVIVDDEAIEEQSRGWLLERVRNYAPQIPFLYVAGNHNDAGEKRARTYAAGYYTSKPIDSESLRRVLASFLSHATPLSRK